jgi:hypothetical protein
MQVAKRPHGGQNDFVSQCFRNSERWCMRYCRSDMKPYYEAF